MMYSGRISYAEIAELSQGKDFCNNSSLPCFCQHGP